MSDCGISPRPFAKKSLSSLGLVGAVGTENNTGWNFKELEMQCNAKTLKRNRHESNGILIGSSMAPIFSNS